MTTKPSIYDVADFFIWFGQKHGAPVTHLKLQKLSYYAEAYYWAVYGKSLTGEKFEAWTHGPVSRRLWNMYKDNKWEVIVEECKKPELAKEACNHLKEIANVFFGYNAFELEKMTHSDMPWIKARKGLSMEQRCENIISTIDMKNYYKQYVKA